ncbi:nucleotidyltransferase family protein [Halovivax sp.]|uniref:nucleotidyltransferase family protein n=1 Tax=Halovivax sp. TaxID=1935978 RepID=UPI0025BCA027|nr:nucleotidyltransferase family protein [Halovivax sp.]
MGAIVGVVLAAGEGGRFAAAKKLADERRDASENGATTDNKLLATVDGEPIVRRAARSLAVDGVGRTVAILGDEANAVRDALEDAVDETIENPDYEDGQSASVRLGARRAGELDADAAAFLPGDMPRVDPATTRRLVAAYRSADDEPAAIVPTYEGRRGNPALFNSGQFDALASLSGDTGGRKLFDRIEVRRVPVDDPGIHLDVDTRVDLEHLRWPGGCRD